MKKNYVKLPKMHYACADDELRKVMNYVLVTKDNIVASDAHVLVVHKTSDVFSGFFIENMPERFLIHRFIWAKMCEAAILRIDFDKESQLIHIWKEDYDYFLPIKLEKEMLKYPAWELIIPKETGELSSIGINLNIVEKLRKSLITDNNNIKLTFKDKSTCIKITITESNSYALLMPVLINEN